MPSLKTLKILPNIKLTHSHPFHVFTNHNRPMLNLNQDINTSMFSQHGKVTTNKDGIIEIIGRDEVGEYLGKPMDNRMPTYKILDDTQNKPILNRSPIKCFSSSTKVIIIKKINVK